MLRRSPRALIALSALALLLFGCGDPSSESVNQASQQGDATVETEAETADVSDAVDDVAAVDERYEADQDEAGDTGGYDGPPVQPHRTSAPSAPRRVATAAIGAGVRGDVGMFYDALEHDGSWVYHPDYSYVWIPSRMGPGWRPYQEGRWIWTDDHGWYWESEEPFAWAVYHYGRWDYDPDYGWFWVPGDTWAPAWVTWRLGGNSIGWAPIAPDRPGFAAGAPRRYAPPIAESWVFVDARNFADPDLGTHVLPVSRTGESLQNATDIRTPRYENGRVINFGARREEMQRVVGRGIETREIVYVGNRDDMFEDVSGRRVGIYRPIIADRGARRAPSSVVEVTRSGRVIVREYAQGPYANGYDVPSVALLDVLEESERRDLLETRLTAQEAAVDRRIEQLRKKRAALLKARQKEAARLEAKLEKERKKAMAERRRNREIARKERRQRAADIKLDTRTTGDKGPTEEAKTGPAEKPEQDVAPVQDAAAPAEPARPKAKAKAPAAPLPAETGALPEAGQAEAPARPAEQTVPAAGIAPAPTPAVEAEPGPAPISKPAKGAPAPEPSAEASPGVAGEDDALALPDGAALGEPVSPDDRVPPKKKAKPNTPLEAEANRAAPATPDASPESRAPAPTPEQGAAQKERGTKKQGATPVAPQQGDLTANPQSAPQMQAPAPERSEAAPAPGAPSEAADVPKSKKRGRPEPAEAATQAPPADLPAASPAPAAPAPAPGE